MSDEKLEKNLAGLLTAATLAAGPSPELKNAFSRAQVTPEYVEPVKKAPFDPKSLHPDMHPIAFLESSYGKNTQHKPHAKGEFDTAYGPLGFKPSTAFDEFIKTPHLMQLHPNLKEQDAFFKEFKENPQFYNLVAGAHWNRLKRNTGSAPGAAFAWRWGLKAFQNSDPKMRESDDYVVKYNKLTETQPWAEKNPLNKKEPPNFTKLSVSAESVPKISTDRQAQIADRSILNDFKTKHGKELAIQALRKPVYGRTILSPSGQVKSYAKNAMPSQNSKIKSDPNLGDATAAHEKFHVLMRSVQKKYGLKAAITLAQNLFNRIPSDYQTTLKKYVAHRFPNYTRANPMYHEEHLAALFNYLNSREERVAFHKAIGTLTDKEIAEGSEGMNSEYQVYDRHMKGAFTSLKHLASKADANWLKKVLPLKKSSEQNIVRLASALNGVPDSTSKEFKAAKLINDYTPTDEDLKNAQLTWEDDFIGFVLAAHRIEVNQQNKDKLEEIMRGLDLKKSDDENDFMIMAIPREIRAYDSSSAKYEFITENAFSKNNINSIEVNGKHSHGSALLFDDMTNQFWFLKPGSGNLSSAKGVSETAANQSRREVAFNRIAEIIGLREFVPESGLLLLDRHEVAVLEFFHDYKSINQKIKEKDVVGQIFEPFVADGTLHRLAVLDFILGQTDRHAGNVLYKENKIKLIDAGSAFAGHSFSPGRDYKTYIPIYLRVFSTFRFSKMTPEERVKHMPKPAFAGDMALKQWVLSLPIKDITNLLNEYGIDSVPVIERIKLLQSASGSMADFVNKIWSGMI